MGVVIGVGGIAEWRARASLVARSFARAHTGAKEEKTTATMDLTCQVPSINGPAGCSTMVEKY